MGRGAVMPIRIWSARRRTATSEAYGELVGRYQGCIYTVVSGRVTDREDALDLVQETFVRAYRALGGFRQEAGFYTWLYRIAVRLCIDHSRKRKRRQEPVSLDQYLLQDPIVSPRTPPQRAILARGHQPAPARRPPRRASAALRAVPRGGHPARRRGSLAGEDRPDHGLPHRHRQVAHPAWALPAP